MPPFLTSRIYLNHYLLFPISIISCIAVHLYLYLFDKFTNGGTSTLCANHTRALFPYGIEQNDISFDFTDGSPNDMQHQGVDLEHVVNDGVMFLGETRFYLWVTSFGMVTFTKTHGRFQNIADWSATKSFGPAILPLMYDTAYSALGLSRVYYQVVTQSTRLDRFTEVVRDNVVTGFDFNPDTAVIVTWVNMTNSAMLKFCEETLDHEKCVPHTVQMVLLMEGNRRSFVIFNYQNVPGTNDSRKTVGFYNGRGEFTEVIAGYIPQQITAERGVQLSRRYIFDITNPTVISGGCTCDITKAKLEVFPNYSPMLGGQRVHVSGLCLGDATFQTLMCRFDDLITFAYPISRTMAACSVPMLTMVGEIEFGFSTDRGSTFITLNHFTIVPDTSRTQHVTVPDGLDKTGNSVFNLKSQLLNFTWNASLLGPIYSLVDVYIVVYSIDKNKVNYKHHLLKEGLHNSGIYVHNRTTGPLCRNGCEGIEIGVISVIGRNKTYPYMSLHSKLIPLSWYIADAGKTWAVDKCQRWYDNEKQDLTWTTDIPPCPCNMDQAKADSGRWITGGSCNGTVNSVCKYHTESVLCVKSLPTSHGATSQCCYTKNGSLIHAQESYQGSTWDRSGETGSIPYKHTFRVPQFSHWLHDVQPYLYCCWWSDTCNHYVDDFTLRSHTVIEPTSVDDIYEWFIPEYAVIENHSLFLKPSPYDKTFKPLKIPPSPTSAEKAWMDTFCFLPESGRLSNECVSEYVITKNEKLAQYTGKMAEKFDHIQRVLNTTYKLCLPLIVAHAKKNTYSRSVNTTVTITGCRSNCKLSGSITYTCIENENNVLEWRPKVNAKCDNCFVNVEPVKRDRAKLAGIILAGIIAAALLAAVIAYIIRRQKATRGITRENEMGDKGSAQPLKSRVI